MQRMQSEVDAARGAVAAREGEVRRLNGLLDNATDVDVLALRELSENKDALIEPLSAQAEDLTRRVIELENDGSGDVRAAPLRARRGGVDARRSRSSTRRCRGRVALAEKKEDALAEKRSPTLLAQAENSAGSWRSSPPRATRRARPPTSARRRAAARVGRRGSPRAPRLPRLPRLSARFRAFRASAPSAPRAFRAFRGFARLPRGRAFRAFRAFRAARTPRARRAPPTARRLRPRAAAELKRCGGVGCGAPRAGRRGSWTRCDASTRARARVRRSSPRSSAAR